LKIRRIVAAQAATANAVLKNNAQTAVKILPHEHKLFYP
jgi:hypothetical protein